MKKKITLPPKRGSHRMLLSPTVPISVTMFLETPTVNKTEVYGMAELIKGRWDLKLRNPQHGNSDVKAESLAFPACVTKLFYCLGNLHVLLASAKTLPPPEGFPWFILPDWAKCPSSVSPDTLHGQNWTGSLSHGLSVLGSVPLPLCKLWEAQSSLCSHTSLLSSQRTT